MKGKLLILDSDAAWHEVRAKARVTASQVHRIMANGKRADGLSAGALTYCMERAAELLAKPDPSFTSYAMQRGNDLEPVAALAFADRFGYDVNSNDFIYTSEGGRVFLLGDGCGGTPDILLPDSIVEIKCPDSRKHLEFSLMTSGGDLADIAPDYYAQMQMNMMLHGCEFGTFVSFDDRFYNESHRLFTLTVDRDADYIDRMMVKVEAVNAEIDRILTLYRACEMAKYL
jgi:hypothetical protein